MSKIFNHFLERNGHGLMEILAKIALLEGEGFGTAYEYYVKLRLLDLLVSEKRIEAPDTILIYGLPEKYGVALDVLLLGKIYESEVTVIETRETVLQKLRFLLKQLLKCGLNLGKVNFIKVSRLSELGRNTQKPYSLVVSTEVLQKLPKEEKMKYLQHMESITRNAAVFVPNSENRAHERISHLRGLRLQELIDHCDVDRELRIQRYGYIDIPPFPPGLKLSRSQSAHETGKRQFGKKSMLMITFLKRWYRLEEMMPQTIKRRTAHMVYAVISF